MKAAKLILGIISFVLAAFILFQSCAAGISNALEENGEIGGTAGVLLALILIATGVIIIVVRNKVSKAAYVAGGLNIAGALIALAGAGSYSDLTVWAVVAAIFGVIYIVLNITGRRKGEKRS